MRRALARAARRGRLLGRVVRAVQGTCTVTRERGRGTRRARSSSRRSTSTRTRSSRRTTTSAAFPRSRRFGTGRSSRSSWAFDRPQRRRVPRRADRPDCGRALADALRESGEEPDVLDALEAGDYERALERLLEEASTRSRTPRARPRAHGRDLRGARPGASAVSCTAAGSPPPFTDAVRLNAYLARAGVASRREADVLIKAGRVRVNGEPGQLNTFVTDRRRRRGRRRPRRRAARSRTCSCTSRPGVVTTARDPGGRPTVVDLVRPRALG